MASNGVDATNGTSAHSSSKPSTTCHHLSKVLTASGSKLEDLIVKARAQHSLAPGGDDVDSQKPAQGLGVRYVCLLCAESGHMGTISIHAKEKKHRIWIDTRSGFLYCTSCKDALYDRTAEHIHLYGNAPDESKKRKLSDTADPESYIANNSSSTPCSREGARGLFNLGQTCYMNSVVQSLLHDPVLVSYFLGEGHSPHKCDTEDCIACAMTELFAECRATDRQDGYAALSLLLASWKQMPSLAGYAQQDAHEYYQALVDKLHESVSVSGMNDGPCRCFFHNTFFGRLRSTITCTACGEQRQTDDPINDLSLHMEIQQAVRKKEKTNGASGDAQRYAPTLQSCLDAYTAKEKLSATCKNCGNIPKPATKQLKLRKLPAILCMQMKRFDGGSKSESTKIEGKVDFPLTLDMTPYTTSHPATCLDRKQDSASTPFSKPVIPTERFIYDLTSVIVHKGTLDSGHYYTYCRESASSASSSPLPSSDTPPNENVIRSQDRWYLFNDDRVTLASLKEVLAADAYLLFYGLRWLPPQDPHRPVPPPVVKHRVDVESSDSE